MTRAVVLLSGGLDSATCLAMARAEGCECHALTVAYGQRHHIELRAAERVAVHLGAASHRVIRIDLRAFGGSALTDDRIEVPKGGEKQQSSKAEKQQMGEHGLSRTPSRGTGEGIGQHRLDPRTDQVGGTGLGTGHGQSEIPVTYVPARNTIFLAYALGFAEVLGAERIYVGVNAVDYSGYPDCRPAFVEAFQRLADVATRAGVEGRGPRVVTPLLMLTKVEIIRKGLALGVDFSMTHSCYDPSESGAACGRCDSCRIREAAFAEVGRHQA
jgi:7-cyano-7-deazaguanine synthase